MHLKCNSTWQQQQQQHWFGISIDECPHNQSHHYENTSTHVATCSLLTCACVWASVYILNVLICIAKWLDSSFRNPLIPLKKTNKIHWKPTQHQCQQWCEQTCQHTHTHTQTYHTHVHECTNKLKHINTHSYTSAMHANNHIAHLFNQHIYTSLPIHIHITMNTTMCHTQTHLYYIHAHLYYIHAHTHYIHEDMNCMHSHYQPKAMIMPHHTHKLHCKLTSKQAQEPCICEQPTQWILQCKEDQQHTYEPDNHSQ